MINTLCHAVGTSLYEMHLRNVELLHWLLVQIPNLSSGVWLVSWRSRCCSNATLEVRESVVGPQIF